MEGHLGAVPDSLTDFWVALVKISVEFTDLFNRPVIFNICSHPNAQNKKTAFPPNCPVARVGGT